MHRAVTAASNLLRHRSVQIALVIPIVSVGFVALSVRTPPFNWGAMAMPGMASTTNMSAGYQLMSANIQIVWSLCQMLWQSPSSALCDQAAFMA